MPKLKNKVPIYRLHMVSGQAVVTLNSHDYYLGIYNTEESRENYQRVIKEWLVNHRHVLPNTTDNSQL